MASTAQCASYGNSDADVCAIARLRSYVPPPTSWHALPLSRRAAVLILLFADRKGDLRVVLTIRSSTLKNYAGQAALPGGKTDSSQETPFQTARREAYEEIGLPLTDTKLPPPFAVEHLTEFPCQLAMTNLGVRPCVAFLSPSSSRATSSSSNSTATTSTASSPTVSRSPNVSDPTAPNASAAPPSSASSSSPILDVETALIPRLDAKEVAAVFTAPFHHFLKLTDEEGSRDWYRGQWQEFHSTRWKMHNFYVPITRRSVAVARMEVETVDEKERRSSGGGERKGEGGREKDGSGRELAGGEVGRGAKEGTRVAARKKPKSDTERKGYQDQGSSVDQIIHPENKFRVFGMTARILVDAARIAYGEEPEFESNQHHGDEEIIARLLRQGYLVGKKKEGEESVRRMARF
ncbi:hypothetical protein EV356DRAFT_514695 [Viridothelium virens]|uniref:Nudix hydrolase domain-containing protein n=1 Tax=Viridothelium virens TaxID=1048519 RepID=A0A6A6HB54_VIRVR|nr:hypothetical protein EV356DRAFT_514695 [Viridothelium virens]